MSFGQAADLNLLTMCAHFKDNVYYQKDLPRQVSLFVHRAQESTEYTVLTQIGL